MMVPWVDGSELTPRVCFLSLNLEMVLYPKKRSLWSAIGQGLSIPGEVWTSAHSFRNQQPPGDECGLFSWGHLTWRFFFLIMQSTVSILYGRVLIIIVYIYMYFGRVCLGFFDWDTYPGSQAQLQGLSVKCFDFPVQSRVLFGSSN
jgi:hypothetical protein